MSAKSKTYRTRRNYLLCIKLGRCVGCSTRLGDKDGRRCPECAARHRAKAKAMYRQQGRAGR